eukprot:5140063-Pleurochrysis_carterae.AAC.1
MLVGYRAMVHGTGVSLRDGVALGALCVRFGTWVLRRDARTLTSGAGVIFRSDLCLHALPFGHGPRVLSGDVASTHQCGLPVAVCGGPQQLANRQQRVAH